MDIKSALTKEEASQFAALVHLAGTEVYEDEVNDLVVFLNKDAKVDGIEPMDTLMEYLLDLYHLSVLKNERPPFVVLGLLAFVGWAWEKGQENV